MATGQTGLDYMEMLNQELQLQSGEVDVTRGLLALNVAQDYFESLAATHPNIFGSSTGTVTTTANTETTTFPTGVLRIDRLHLLDASTSRPKRELESLKRVGGHTARSLWPLNLITTTTGEPLSYWTNGTNIYWSPLPSGTSTVRWYGFQSATAITASGTFTYPDPVLFPLASFAVRIMKSGVDDSANDVAAIAQEVFTAVINTLTHLNRDGATGFEYTAIHDA